MLTALQVSESHSEYVVSQVIDFLKGDTCADRADKTLDYADRIKGDLHTVRLGSLPSLAVNNPILCKQFFVSLLDLQYHDKVCSSYSSVFERLMKSRTRYKH